MTKDIDGCSGCAYENLTINRFKTYALDTLGVDIDEKLSADDDSFGIEMDAESLKDPEQETVKFYQTFNGWRTNWGFEQYVEMPKSFIDSPASQHTLHPSE